MGLRGEPTAPLPAHLYNRCGYRNAKVMEVVRGFHPRRIPKSLARGGAGVAVKNVKSILWWMVGTVDYDRYADDELRYCRFKSPFDRRPLVGPRPRFRKNEGKRSLRLVGSCDPNYILQCEEAAFGDFESDDEDWEYEDEQ